MRLRLRRPAGGLRSRRTAQPDARIAELQHRLEHLEEALEGLQDALHRESLRREGEVRELNKHTQPAAIARALSDDARRRGI